MEVSVPKQSHADGGAIDWVTPPVPRPAGVLVDAVNQAASKIQAGTVADGMTADEILADPEARERASRWRGGNASQNHSSFCQATECAPYYEGSQNFSGCQSASYH